MIHVFYLYDIDLPIVAVESDELKVLYGEEVKITCNIIADPGVEIVYWKKEADGRTIIINHGAVGTQGVTPFNPSLILQSTTKADSGEYTCFAINDIGTGQSGSTLLNVIGGEFWFMIFHGILKKY